MIETTTLARKTESAGTTKIVGTAWATGWLEPQGQPGPQDDSNRKDGQDREMTEIPDIAGRGNRQYKKNVRDSSPQYDPGYADRKHPNPRPRNATNQAATTQD